MPRWAARTDATQAAIVDALRQMGCTVAITARVGGGFPDLVVARNVSGVVMLLETKIRGKGLNEAQREFHSRWNGRIGVVRTPEEAIKYVEENS